MPNRVALTRLNRRKQMLYNVRNPGPKDIPEEIMKVLDMIRTPIVKAPQSYFNLFDVPKTKPSYPPYNVKRMDDQNYVVELALAGFKENDLNVSVEDNRLIVEGKIEQSTDLDGWNYVYQGIASRAFRREWSLEEGSEIKSAEFVDGILSIHIKNVTKEENKRVKKIPIGKKPELLNE